jgi:polyisoprenoid-binding protein YceI
VTQPDSAPSAGTYRLDPQRSTVRADVKAMFGLFTVHGKLQLQSGEIVVADDPAGSSVSASIDAGSYDSGNGKRDKDVKAATLLDAQAYPDITFEGAQVRPDGAGWVVSGSVTAHGTSVPAEVHVTQARMEGGAARFQATARLDRLSFGVTKKKGMVGQTVDVVIDAVGVPA